MEKSFEAGAALLRKLKSDGLKAVLVWTRCGNQR